MPRIQKLSQAIVNKIAAGEVIERPASVVKELLENSVDALSTRIDVDIVAGGGELIRIVDDGEGIEPDDLLLAVTSHATSKLQSADDLFRVHTLGFRGEALASVAEVSRLKIRSRTAQFPDGAELTVDLGDISPIRPCGCPVGTQIEVRNLFENTPVRRKFMKSVSTEFGRISEQFSRIALANPRLRMSLRHNEKTVFDLPASEEPLERLRLFYGKELADQLIRVDSEHNGVRLWGYIGHPDLSKSTRKSQYLFLNGRCIQDRSLQHALTEGYRGLLMVGRYPVAFLFLEVPADQVDVNVHPTKIEVRFRDGQQLFRQVLAMVRQKFRSMELDSCLSVVRAAETARLSSGDWKPAPAARGAATLTQTDFADWARNELATWTPDRPPRLSPSTTTLAPSVETAPATETDRPDPAPTPASAGMVSPPARAMQIHDCYLLVETEDGLTVIDQHALHERILFEQFRERVLAGAVESQRLLVPAAIELSVRDAATVLEKADLLASLGLGVEDFGQGTVLVDRYPAMLGKIDIEVFLHDLAERLEADHHQPGRRDLLEDLLSMMACKAAVKAGQRLNADEIDSLLAQRHLVDDHHHCPHGRPTALKLSRQELDRQFGRLG
ncbi:MAG: DNA mismatch repair endonuclease MutL [Planctomycetaceae bacterium]|nr:DNA mismatch repair endonuclease MutL [Planctomycetaceae bacterium]